METAKGNTTLDIKKIESVNENAFEVDSDNFSIDSLECGDKNEGRGILFTSEKRCKEDASSTKEKVGGISGMNLCKEPSTSFRNCDATISHIHRLQKSSFNTQNRRKEQSPPMNNCADLRVRHIPTEQKLLGHKQFERGRAKLQRVLKDEKSSPTKPNRPLSKRIMKNDVLLRTSKDRSLTRKPQTEKTNVTHIRHTSLPARTHQCSLTKGQKNVGFPKSYLERYRFKKLELERGKSSKASTCSTFADFSVLTLSSSDVGSTCKSSSEDEDHGCEIQQVLKDLTLADGRNNVCSDSENLTSISQVGSPRKRRSRSYVPYGIKSFQALVPPRMGSLGPDIFSNKDQIQKLQRRKAYAQQVHERNSRIIHASRARNKAQVHILTEDNTGICEPPLKMPEVSTLPSSTTEPAIRSKPGGRRRRGKNINRKQRESMQQNNARLENLQQRHLKEVKLVEVLRKNIKGSLDAV